MSDIAAEVPAPRTAREAEVRVATAPGRGRRWLRNIAWRHVILLAAVVFSLFPVVWVVSASINPTGSLAGQKLIPADPTLLNYRNLLSGTIAGNPVPYKSWWINSIVIAGGAAVTNVFLSSLAAYAFSRMRFRGRRPGLLGLLLVQMFPQNLLAVALFLLMVNIGDVFPSIGIGTKLGLFLIYLGGALGVNTWLMKGFFDTIPISLDESARVDGATHTQTFFQIILPLVAPILAVTTLLTFILLMNEFILASVMLRESKDFTLAVGLFRFVSQRYGARWGPFTAGALMGGVPVVILWFTVQRYIVSGLTRGAVKG
jgi:arabinogalactan oligomer / maltooligosaccharide transport system permease protein